MQKISMLLILALIIRVKRPAKIAESEKVQTFQEESVYNGLIRIIFET